MYPPTEPAGQGMLAVGDGNTIFWQVHGNPDGRPAVCLHGGPGSGCSGWWARFFDPARYRIVLMDQRGCGRSLPNAGDPTTDLATNTTQHLIADLERLREHLGIERWLVFGGSWGSTLGLAYAQAHPDRTERLVLFSVVTTTRREVDWITRQMGRIFPAQWARFRDGVPADDRDGNLADAYARLLADPDPAVRDRAARDWCDWEDTHVAIRADHKPDPRFADPALRMTFARLVTHYWRHAGFLEEDVLIREAWRLDGIPGVLVTGRLDVSSPSDIAWHLAQRWRGAELVVVDDAGHGTGYPSMSQAVVGALDRIASAG